MSYDVFLKTSKGQKLMLQQNSDNAVSNAFFDKGGFGIATKDSYFIRSQNHRANTTGTTSTSLSTTLIQQLHPSCLHFQNSSVSPMHLNESKCCYHHLLESQYNSVLFCESVPAVISLRSDQHFVKAHITSSLCARGHLTQLSLRRLLF